MGRYLKRRSLPERRTVADGLKRGTGSAPIGRSLVKLWLEEPLCWWRRSSSAAGHSIALDQRPQEVEWSAGTDLHRWLTRATEWVVGVPMRELVGTLSCLEHARSYSRQAVRYKSP
jgi:hypothetical protein